MRGQEASAKVAAVLQKSEGDRGECPPPRGRSGWCQLRDVRDRACGGTALRVRLSREKFLISTHSSVDIG